MRGKIWICSQFSHYVSHECACKRVKVLENGYFVLLAAEPNHINFYSGFECTKVHLTQSWKFFTFKFQATNQQNIRESEFSTNSPLSTVTRVAKKGENWKNVRNSNWETGIVENSVKTTNNFLVSSENVFTKPVMKLSANWFVKDYYFNYGQ